MNDRSSGTPPSPSRSILVVDHEEMMRDLMQQALAQDAQEVLTEANGEEAMFILVREHIDLIISEVVRPDMAGI